MRGRPTIRPWMRTDLLTVSPETPVIEAVALLIRNDLSGAPVLGPTGALVGVVTAKDCFRAALHASYYQGAHEIVADFMTREVETIPADTDLVTAAQMFLERSFRRFPVVEEGRLIGVLSRMDLLRALDAHWKTL